MKARTRLHSPTPLLALLAGLALPAGPASAQLPPIGYKMTNADVAYPPVSEHEPRIATLRTGGQSSMELFAITRSGLSYRYFTRVAGSVDAPWGNWVHRGAPSAQAGPPENWRRSLPATGGWFGQGNDLLAFFDVPDSAASEKIAVADLGNYTAATSTTPPTPTTSAFSLQDPGFGTGGIPAERFNPRTVLTSTGSDHVDVFGTSDDVGASNLQTPLLRLHGTRGANGWSWAATSLGRPPLSLNGQTPDARVGPQAGATFLLGSPAVVTHLVFVKAKFGAEDHVTFVTGTTNGGPFSWGIDLGSPRPGAQIIDEPLALYYQWGGFTRVCVFATAFNRSVTPNRFEVFERHFDTVAGAVPSNPSAWTAWQSFGAPPNLSSQTPFRLTTDVTWYQGSTLRINMFGHADSDSVNSKPEQMVEFYWNGSTWHWGGLRLTPNGTGIRTSCAVVLQATNYTRITVLGRTGGDANYPGSGSIWEMYWTNENGVDHDWTWRDLSWEPAVIRLGF